MIKKILLAILVSILCLVFVVAFKSPDYKISREIKIEASAEKVFPFINNSRKANDWMPWAESDPQIKMTFNGPEEGVGSVSAWESPGEMGVGQAEIIESLPNVGTKSKITYIKPMSFEQLSEFSLTPSESAVIMRWTVTGKNNFIGRLFCLFADMDKMVGANFEKGLQKLKAQVETEKL